MIFSNLFFILGRLSSRQASSIHRVYLAFPDYATKDSITPLMSSQLAVKDKGRPEAATNEIYMKTYLTSTVIGPLCDAISQLL